MSGILTEHAIRRILADTRHETTCKSSVLFRSYLTLAITACPGCGDLLGDAAVFGLEMHEGCQVDEQDPPLSDL